MAESRELIEARLLVERARLLDRIAHQEIVSRKGETDEAMDDRGSRGAGPRGPGGCGQRSSAVADLKSKS